MNHHWKYFTAQHISAAIFAMAAIGIIAGYSCAPIRNVSDNKKSIQQRDAALARAITFTDTKAPSP